jgi:hypothetical protein
MAPRTVSVFCTFSVSEPAAAYCLSTPPVSTVSSLTVMAGAEIVPRTVAVSAKIGRDRSRLAPLKSRLTARIGSGLCSFAAFLMNTESKR